MMCVSYLFIHAKVISEIFFADWVILMIVVSFDHQILMLNFQNHFVQKLSPVEDTINYIYIIVHM